MTTAYASEVCPVALRAYLTTYVNLCWVFGQLIATGVLTSFLKRTDEWAYRIPFVNSSPHHNDPKIHQLTLSSRLSNGCGQYHY